MKRPTLLSPQEIHAMEVLGRRVRLARLRRNMSQEEVAQRIGVTRRTYLALEKGQETVNIGVLVKVMAVLGYVERLEDILASDPLGEEMETIYGRKRAGYISA